MSANSRFMFAQIFSIGFKSGEYAGRPARLNNRRNLPAKPRTANITMMPRTNRPVRE
jgi:hypothetical protein